MKSQPLPHYQQFLRLLLVLFPALLFGACSDDCETTITYVTQEPIYMLRADLRQAVRVKQPHVMEEPGKIYAKGRYLFVNEVNKGIHVVDNETSLLPVSANFISV